MGCHANVAMDRFPKQGSDLGKEVKVCFYYDSSNSIKGKVIRDDTEEPFQTFIQLEDNRVVRATECMYCTSL